MVVPRNRPLISKSKINSHGLTQIRTDQKFFLVNPTRMPRA